MKTRIYWSEHWSDYLFSFKPDGYVYALSDREKYWYRFTLDLSLELVAEF